GSEVWVLTRPDDGKPANDAFLKENPNPNLHFVYFTLPIFGGFWKLGSIAFVLHYYLWQMQAYFVARRLHREIEFDVTHHVTFVRYSSPSFLSFLPVPFIWGTVGGAEAAPKPFFRDFSLRAQVYEFLRWSAHKVGEYDPFARLTARRTAIAQVTTEDTARQVRKMGAGRVAIVPEASLPATDIEQLAQCPPPEGETIRFISMGRLLHWKGFYLGIRAFAQANLANAEYWILGDGVERESFEQLAQQLGVSDRVQFWGNLPRSQTLERLGQSHVLVHPSLHDSGGWVCLEGMAAARPILCLDLGGPSVQIDDETGIKVPAQTPEQAVGDLAKAMQRLADDPELRQRLGAAGQYKVQTQFNWQAKGKQIADLYDKLGGEIMPVRESRPAI
ncbi:MAG: glycosyltransferase, partial [Leptolyngbya sp. SIO4C1]|nr:glycosyltransferase [Leptolyngbya sp. SIO4C1]